MNYCTLFVVGVWLMSSFWDAR